MLADLCAELLIVGCMSFLPRRQSVEYEGSLPALVRVIGRLIALAE
jgi:hypothetical protein